MNALVSGVREFDGFSPIAHITIPLSVPADPDSMPHTPEQSLDPLASIGLFDVTPGSADYARMAGAVKTLTLPGEMGEALKVIALTRGAVPDLPGFAGRDLRTRL